VTLRGQPAVAVLRDQQAVAVLRDEQAVAVGILPGSAAGP
jgi:hypothetical protein